MDTIKDKIVLITGSTDGIGKQTAIDLAERGARVIIHGRSDQRAKAIAMELINRTGNSRIEYVVADLGSLAEIRRMADEIHNRFEKIDVLINNAGVYKRQRELSFDGYEMTFAINQLSYFLITNLLLDLIKKSDFARIINVASQAHASSLDFDNLLGEKYYEGYDAYSRSKLCNILFTFKLANMLEETHVTANTLHPGVIRTKLLQAGWGFGGSSLSHGSKTSVYLATSPDVKNISGKYFFNSQVTRPSAISYDKSVQDKLWKECQYLVN